MRGVAPGQHLAVEEQDLAWRPGRHLGRRRLGGGEHLRLRHCGRASHVELLDEDPVLEDDVVAPQFDVVEAGAVAQRVISEVEDVITLVVREVKLQEVEAFVDGLGQPEFPHEQLNGADPTAGDGLCLGGGLVVDVRGGKDRLQRGRGDGPVEPLSDSPLAGGVASGNGFFARIWSDYIDLVGVRRENRELRESIKVLNARVLEENEALIANERLKRLLELKSATRIPSLAASVKKGVASPKLCVCRRFRRRPQSSAVLVVIRRNQHRTASFLGHPIMSEYIA